MKKILLLIVVSSAFTLLKAQQKNSYYPEVGRPCPDFLFEEVHYYPQKKLSLSDLNGKYFILDFWGKHCFSCIRSFPKMNALQSKFKEKLQIILVGEDDPQKEIRPLYEMLRKEQNLQLACAFDTTVLNQMIPPQTGVPYLVWVDKNGIVKAVTESDDATEQNVINFLEDREFSFYDTSFQGYQKQKKSYNRFKPFFIDGNVGAETDFLFRSVLSKWKLGMALDINNMDAYIRTKQSMFQVSGASLEILYNLAYYGQSIPLDKNTYAHPILNLRDKSNFHENKNGIENNMYCYSLIVPTEKVSEIYFMRCMQNDMKNYFTYRASIEEHEMPCYVLVVTNQAKLPFYKENGKKKTSWSKALGGSMDDISIGDAIEFLTMGLPNSIRLIDETHIKKHINLEIKASMGNIESVNAALDGLGLRMKYVKRKMKVLVITDSDI